MGTASPSSSTASTAEPNVGGASRIVAPPLPHSSCVGLNVALDLRRKHLTKPLHLALVPHRHPHPLRPALPHAADHHPLRGQLLDHLLRWLLHIDHEAVAL